MKINRYIDHTMLRPTTTEGEVLQHCFEAKEYEFFSVCVNGCYVSLAAQELKGTDVKVTAVIGFPLGAMSREAKVFEAKKCIEDGAAEIDMVINMGFLKSGELKKVEDEIRAVKEAIGDRVLKVIIETCYLSDEEKVTACKLALNAEADFVKTSTGFGSGGATFEDVALMKKAVGRRAKIKASGGIKDFETAMKYIEMGVERLGTSSGVMLAIKDKEK